MLERLIRRRAALIAASIVVAWIGAAVVASAHRIQERSQTEGLKETENFVKAGAETSNAVAKAKLQLQETLAAYNALVTQPSKDMKGEYKKLLKTVKQTDEKVDEARGRIGQMDSTGNMYFSGRAETIKKIQSKELRDQAEQRLSDNRREYGTVVAALRDAGQALQPVRTDLDNQIAYLGSDLSPSGTTSLKSQAVNLNKIGAVAFEKADQAIATANAYFHSIRPTKS